MRTNIRAIAGFLALMCIGAVVCTAGAQQDSDSAFEAAANDARAQLEEALAELAALREEMANEKIPLSRELRALETELVELRAEYQQRSRLLDSRTLDLSNLRTEIKARQEEATYLSNLLGEYIRNLESRIHISEMQLHRELLDDAKLARENDGLSEHEVYEKQTAIVGMSLSRLEGMLGGARFSGSAVDSNGLVRAGDFFLVGPAALFVSGDEQHVGTVEQRLGSIEPTIVPFASEDHARAATAAVAGTGNAFPFDPSLGNAHLIETTQESLWEHVQKGGPVMVPIFALASIALLVALYKWLTLSMVQRPSRKRIAALLDALSHRDVPDSKAAARAIRGPTGRMLEVGVAHLGEPRELIEEVMFEQVLATRLKLQRLLPLIAISAAAAPLLGLLGTVTGIISTFQLITIFGTGDVKTLSGGISEALITTKFGLIVAIPSLLLHAFLSRKAKDIVDQMEKTAVAVMNQLAKSWRDEVSSETGSNTSSEEAESQKPLTAAELRAILDDVMQPIHERIAQQSSRPIDRPRTVQPAVAVAASAPSSHNASGRTSDGNAARAGNL